ncbi:hypothetical protein KSF_016940 [Reticulibacter mediterranei]|uniref:Putative proline/betaine transporter n=1 Tax=Reticulibacter mediterranei TaxID=2778369 RepID=A0A8J3ICA0_9CHLR|nr:hypothetical protein KSF_016940 [Reticulibacter mediterranei]
MASIPEQMAERRMLPVIVASTLGTTIEWYDFFLYGTVAALVFPSLYFPQSDAFVGTLLSLTTFLIGFIARPIGGIVFGHLGDRIGRKSTLIATLLLMGISTVLIGCIPGYNVIGVTAPILVSVLRFCQGLGVGGEWGGSVLLALEHGHERNRGFWASWPQAGVPIGLVLSAGLVAIFAGISGDQFSNWGWRVPFLLSALLIAVGLYIRLRIMETPLFTKVQEAKQEARLPVWDVLRSNWEEVILSAAVRFVEQAPFYLFSVFVLVYGAQYLHADRQLILAGIYIAAIIEFFHDPLLRSTLGSLWEAEMVYARLLVNAAVCLPLLPPVEYWEPCVDYSRDCAFAGRFPLFCLWTPGRADLRAFQHSVALQWRVHWLSACRPLRWWFSSAHCGCPA